MPRTVFVVGAGASAEFGLPLGSTLAAEIRNRLQGELAAHPSTSRPILDGSMNLGTSLGLHGDYSAAARILAAGLISARSIDRLLESRSDDPLVAPMGKYAIARVIAEREAASLLNTTIDIEWDSIQAALSHAAQTWIGNLFSMLQEGHRPVGADKIVNDISFITFNYDRIIERYFQLAFQHIMALSPEQASEISRAIPVEHVYGSLGSVFDQTPYGPNLSLVFESVKYFNTLSEGVVEGKIEALQSMISGAQLIVFLGFAFDPVNVKALFGIPLDSSQRIIATSMGLSSRELSLAQSSMGYKSQVFETLPVTCSDLIKSEEFRNQFLN